LVFLDLYLEVIEGAELLIVSDFSHYGDRESLAIEVARVVEEVRLKERDTFPIGSHTCIGRIIELYLESIDSILDDARCEFDIGGRIPYSSTEFFAVDDDTREGHKKTKTKNKD
jgi:hypothetical protein